MKEITWDGIMHAALNMPGIKVDRDSFLIKTFAPYGENPQLLVNSRPSEIYSEKVIHKVASNIISNHTTKVTAISAAAGIPGGFAMFGTIPADMAQFYWHYLVMAQKLAYVYGWPDLRNEQNELGEGAQQILTVFMGIGFGLEAAHGAIRKIAIEAAKHWAKKLPQMTLTKTFWYPIIKNIAKFIGVKITKDSVGKAAGKIIPFIGAVFSGGLTLITFKPMANRLNKELQTTALLRSTFPEKD
ncbi:MAG: hypothetical protein J1E16_09990 [Muribaculaceae bacterium]|nr:hypothetical protein [Muribaculaceae bacterium]